MEDYTAEMIRDMAFSFCPQCGTAIVPNHKGRPRKFCSPECRSRWNNTHPKPENWKTVRSKICPVCGREFSYGDVSAISGADLPPVDIITFGSPCQDMSIAGKRDGLDGSRSSLFYEAIRIVKEMRCKTNGEKPRFIVWENVPGAFSSNKGQDFKAVLEAVIGVKEPSASVPAPEKKGWPDADYYVGDGWSVAYRVLDAQWWGVPQRRKRIYLVADFAGQSAPEILFNSEGLSRYSAEGFRAWQRTASGVESGTGETGGTGGYAA